MSFQQCLLIIIFVAAPYMIQIGAKNGFTESDRLAFIFLSVFFLDAILL